MTDFKVRIANTFSEHEKALVIFSSCEKKNYLIEAGKSEEFSIPDVGEMAPKHYLLMSLSPGAGRVSACKIGMPIFSQITFVPMEKASVTVSNQNSQVFLSIPAGLPTWQLQITRSVNILEQAKSDGDDGPNNVTVGEDEDGG